MRVGVCVCGSDHVTPVQNTGASVFKSRRSLSRLKGNNQLISWLISLLITELKFGHVTAALQSTLTIIQRASVHEHGKLTD